MNIQELFFEFDEHLQKDDKPSDYFNDLMDKGGFIQYPYATLKELKGVEQSPLHHPEGSVWNHTMLVVDNAAERRSLSRNSRVFMWAALLHDVGKIPTTKIKNGKITAYDHDRQGEKMARRFLGKLTNDTDFINEVAILIRWHMQILYVVKDLPFANIEDMIKEVSIDEIGLLSLCDRLGRGDIDEEKRAEELRNVDIFIDKCKGKTNH